MPSKARAKRTASMAPTVVSRKLTKKSAKPAPAKVKGSSSKKSHPPKWLKPVESRLAPAQWAERLAAADFQERWNTWIGAENRPPNAEWAATAIELVEVTGAGLFGEPAQARQTEELKKIAREATALSFETAPIAHQLLTGELRLKLGVLTDDRALSEEGLVSLINGLEVMLDGEGTPHKKYLPIFPELVACWLRSFSLAKRKGVEVHNLTDAQREAFAQCRWLPLRLAQLSRANGAAIFAAGDEKISGDLIKSSLDVWGDKTDRRNAACLRKDLANPTPKPSVEKIARAVCGDWSGIGVFRAEARPETAYVGVALDDAEFLLEFGVKGTPLASGAARLTLTRDGHPVGPTGQWEEVCRHQEPEIEYWELERTHERGVWIQRQVALSCKDEFAYICDNIVADSPGDLTYRLEAPLVKGVSAIEAEETREITLCRDKIRATVLPLAAEEWRTTPSYFEFRQENSHLRFDGRTRQSRMSIPWIVDLRGLKKTEQVTWRQLRVAENLQNLPRDIAVAFRWQIGAQQWMAYRSLAAPSNRTVLGQNLISDFAIARVFANGKTKTIVEIE